MRALLIFPPGWMQFGPYLSLPLLKGYVEAHGAQLDLLDLNIEFYDWVLSQATLTAVGPRIDERLTHMRGSLSTIERARLCKAALTREALAERVEAAKATLRSSARYDDDSEREAAKRDLCAALGVVASAFSGLTITPSEIGFANCGLDPRRVLAFLKSEANIMSWFYQDRVSALVAEKSYDFIGLSLPAWEQLVPALTLVRALRSDGPGRDSHVCLGGNFVTRMVGTWGDRAHPFTTIVDSFSVFDGERSLLQLLAAIDESSPLEEVENLVLCRGDRMVRTRTSEVDINSLPTPNFDGLELESYLAPEPILPLYTSRSCPYKCSFCTIPYASSGFRQRDADKVVDDLEQLSDRYGVRMYSFVDETLTVSVLRDCAEAINRRGLDLRWYGETRCHPEIDSELCEELYRSGCRKLQFGVESYNQRVLNAMKKGVKLEIIRPNLEACLSAGIAVHLFTFYGFPGEEEHEARRTHEFAQSILARSFEVHENPYSSVGTGTFNLEAYSDVYHYPDRYGVRLLGRDSFFDVDYEVERGMSRAEVEALANELGNISVFRDLCRTSGRLWWQMLSGMETNEDESFVLYCLREARPRSVGAEAPSQLGLATPPTRQLVGSASLCELALAERVLVREFDDGFGGWEHDEDHAVTCFYSLERDVYINIPAHVGRFVCHCIDQGCLPRPLNRNLLETVNLLSRNHMIEISGPDVVETVSLDHPDCTLEWNPDFAIYQCRSERIELFNTVSQALVSVDPASALIASLTRQRPLTLAELTAAIEHELGDASTSRTNEMLEQLVAGQIILALPRGSSTGREHRCATGGPSWATSR